LAGAGAGDTDTTWILAGAEVGDVITQKILAGAEVGDITQKILAGAGAARKNVVAKQPKGLLTYVYVVFIIQRSTHEKKKINHI
jgi:hypothetical protein